MRKSKILADNFFRTWMRSNHSKGVRLRISLRDILNKLYKYIYNIKYKLYNLLYKYKIIGTYDNSYIHNLAHGYFFREVHTDFYDGVLQINREVQEVKCDKGFCTKKGKRLFETVNSKDSLIVYRSQLFEGVTVKLFNSSGAPENLYYFDFEKRPTLEVNMLPTMPIGNPQSSGESHKVLIDSKPLADLRYRYTIPAEDVDREGDALQCIVENFERSLNDIPVGRLIQHTERRF